MDEVLEEGIHPMADLIRQAIEESRAGREAYLEVSRGLAGVAAELKSAAAALAEAIARQPAPAAEPSKVRDLPIADQTFSVGAAVRKFFGEHPRTLDSLVAPGSRFSVRATESPIPLAEAVKATWTLSGLSSLVPPQIVPALPPAWPANLVDVIVAAGAVIRVSGPVSVVRVSQGGAEGFGDFQVVGEGGTKPEQPTPTLTTVSISPQFIAGIFAISNSMLRPPQLDVTQQLIDRFWQRALYRVLEREIIGGTGSSTAIEGILDNASILTYNQPADASDNAQELDAVSILRGMALVEDNLQVPRYLISRPSVKYRVIRQLATTREFIVGSWPQELRDVTWVLSPAVPDNTIIVADINPETLALFEYQGVSITFSTEHADFFARNLTAVRVEWEGNFLTLRPTAFCRVNLAANPM